MKKQPSKLKLKKNIIARLSNTQIDQIQGGAVDVSGKLCDLLSTYPDCYGPYPPTYACPTHTAISDGC